MNQASLKRVLLLCLLASSGHLSAAMVAVPPAEHVVHISIDGLSAIHLRNAISNAPERYPTFRRLISEGSTTLNARCDYFYSETVPNHTCMIMGRPVLQPEGWPDTAHHGYTENLYPGGQTYHLNGNSNVSYFSSVFDVVHDRGLSTAFFAGKEKLSIMYRSYDATNGAPDLVDDDNGRNKVDHTQILNWSYPYDPYPYSCELLTGLITDYLAENSPHYTFIHFADLDYIGHYYPGWGSLLWMNNLQKIDSCLSNLIHTIEQNSGLSGQTTIILSADHGGGDPATTHVNPEGLLNYTIPFMVWGPGWPAGQDIYRLFANRFDPGTNRLDYNAPLQPMRNGDGANLAMAILGLPPVPGSSLRPEMGVPSIAISAERSESAVTISWPGPADGFVLESADALAQPAQWQPITEGIQDYRIRKAYPVPSNGDVGSKLFRLRLK